MRKHVRLYGRPGALVVFRDRNKILLDKNTPVTWSTVNSFLAKGDLFASASPFVKWNPELVSAPSLTGWLGRNLREKGLGVFSTWMKTLWPSAALLFLVRSWRRASFCVPVRPRRWCCSAVERLHVSRSE